MWKGTKMEKGSLDDEEKCAFTVIPCQVQETNNTVQRKEAKEGWEWASWTVMFHPMRHPIDIPILWRK